jgi:hypothetical protein
LYRFYYAFWLYHFESVINIDVSLGQNLNGKWGQNDVTQMNANPKLTTESKALLLSGTKTEMKSQRN